jgi:hypothetical protein
MADVWNALDFRRPNSWGHALHGHTFQQVRADTRLQRLVDWWRGTRRYSFMVHCPCHPRAGQTVAWKAETGDRFGNIYRVDWCFNPEDMFTLFVALTEDTSNE